MPLPGCIYSTELKKSSGQLINRQNHPEIFCLKIKKEPQVPSYRSLRPLNLHYLRGLKQPPAMSTKIKPVCLIIYWGFFDLADVATTSAAFTLATADKASSFALFAEAAISSALLAASSAFSTSAVFGFCYRLFC